MGSRQTLVSGAPLDKNELDWVRPKTFLFFQLQSGNKVGMGGRNFIFIYDMQCSIAQQLIKTNWGPQ